MSQPPPPMQPTPGYPQDYAQPGMVTTRTSAAAVTSLICGVLGCFIVTGIAAIITGIIGLKATRDPNVRGRGLAIAGLVLGIVTTIGGAGCLVAGGGMGYWAYKQSAPAVEAVNGFTKAIANGDVDGALKFVDTTSVTREEVEAMTNRFNPLGVPSNMTMQAFNVDASTGVIEVAGPLIYPGGVSKSVRATARKQADGSARITSLQIN